MCSARLGLRVAHRRAQARAEGDRHRRRHGRAALLVFAPHHRRRHRAAVAALVDAAARARQVEPRTMDSAVLCRYGELFLKGGNRARFESALADNVRARAGRPAGARASRRRTGGDRAAAQADERTRPPRASGARLRPRVAVPRAPGRRQAIRGDRRDGRRQRARRGRARSARLVQVRSPPLRQALPASARWTSIVDVGARRPGGDRRARRLTSPRCAWHRGRHRPRLRVRRQTRRARRAARRRVGPRAAAAVGRHRLAGRRLAGRQARPGAGRRLLPLAAVHRREVARQGARAGGRSRAGRR